MAAWGRSPLLVVIPLWMCFGRADTETKCGVDADKTPCLPGEKAHIQALHTEFNMCKNLEHLNPFRTNKANLSNIVRLRDRKQFHSALTRRP